MKAIELVSVSKAYRGKPAVRDVSLAIEPGERWAILGHSGSGKTTLLRLVAGFLAPDTGRIEIHGALVAAEGRTLTTPEKRQLGMVFQDLALWPHLSVKGNLEFGLKAQGIARPEREARMQQMLTLVQMESFLDARPAELSGGQQQRVAIARALVLRPQALLMDEPLSNLDLELNLQLRQEILKLQETLGFTLLYVTHDPYEAFALGTHVALMRHGAIERIGHPAEMKEYFDTLIRRFEQRG